MSMKVTQPPTTTPSMNAASKSIQILHPSLSSCRPVFVNSKKTTAATAARFPKNTMASATQVRASAISTAGV